VNLFLNKIKSASSLRNKIVFGGYQEEDILLKFIANLQTKYAIEIIDIGKLLSIYLSNEKINPFVIESYLISELNKRKFFFKEMNSNMIIVNNIGILFEKSLNFDILNLLKSISDKTVVLVLTKGVFNESENIFYFYKLNSDYKINFADNYIVNFEIDSYEI